MNAIVTTAVDISALSLPCFLIITPMTDEGDAWLLENVGEADADGQYHVEHRYGPDILVGAHEDGVVVALNGRIADAPRGEA